jgi:hypothetical protein
LPTSSSPWQNPWDAQSHRDNQEAAFKTEFEHPTQVGFQKAKLPTHIKKILHTSSGSTGSAKTPYVSFLPIIQTHNSAESSENKTVPKNTPLSNYTGNHTHKNKNCKM